MVVLNLPLVRRGFLTHLVSRKLWDGANIDDLKNDFCSKDEFDTHFQPNVVLNKPCVVILLYHGKGHFNACFTLAKALTETHRVVFAGFEFFTSHVAAQGFEYYPLRSVPFGIGLEEWMNTVEGKKNIWFRTLVDRHTDRLYKLREAELKSLIESLRPVHILLDAQQQTDFIVLFPLLKNTRTKISIIHTMLPAWLDKSLPPINSLALPNDDKGIQRDHSEVNRSKRKRLLKQSLKYGGMNDEAIINRRIKRNQIPSRLISKRKSLFGCNVNGFRQFVTASKSFDFPEARYDDIIFLGPMIDRHRIDLVDQRYHSSFTDITKRIEEDNVRFLYCSVGTVSPKDRTGILTFFRKLALSIKTKNYLLLVSFALTGEEKDELLNLNSTVVFLDGVDQLEVLSKADLFVTHGGLNSIKESIDAGVPMLVYPLDKNFDQNGNSSRVVYHGIGLRGDVVADTPDEILAKIESILNDGKFRERIQKMKSEDTEYQVQQNFLIQQLLSKE